MRLHLSVSNTLVYLIANVMTSNKGELYFHSSCETHIPHIPLPVNMLPGPTSVASIVRYDNNAVILGVSDGFLGWRSEPQRAILRDIT